METILVYPSTVIPKRAIEPTLLDPYAGTDAGEFFAVATECFFDRAVELREQHPELYGVLSAFYRQDTAERERRFTRDPSCVSSH